jgi:hypothetical protein
MARSVYSRNAWRYARNLRKLFAAATDADKAQGLNWYPNAEAGARAWAERMQLDARTVAAVIAAISPQCDWTSNLKIALEVIAGQPRVTGGALRANVDKARRIHADRALDIVGYFKDAPKVSAFCQNLQGNGARVTIDTHAVQAAVNDPLWRKSLHSQAYRIFADVYASVAKEFGLRPCDFQAVIWCAWKAKFTTSDKKRMLAAQRARRTA